MIMKSIPIKQAGTAVGKSTFVKNLLADNLADS